MNTNFDITSYEFKRKTTDRLPKHDLVFGTPFADEAAGIPIGDGSTGSLIWFDKDTIHINVNNTDLWDDSTLEDTCYCSKITEDVTCVRHGGEILVRFDSPFLDSIYQKEFEARLSLADAAVTAFSETPFSHITAKAFASSEAKVTMLRMTVESDEATAPEISLVRWGSRNFWRWYSHFRHLPEAGLGGTDAEAADGRIYIKQKLNGTEFCIGLAITSDTNVDTKQKNSHRGQFSLANSERADFTLYWNVSVGENIDDAKNKCAKALDLAISEGFDELYKKHSEAWAKFWNKSYIAIADDFVENMTYLSLYYSNCECRGKYPPHFTNGVWGFEHDFVPWTYYFHYNMQHMYGPLESTGHGELADNYYRMRRDGLETARLYAEKVKGHKGVFYHDVTDRYGRGANYDSNNCTPTSQIAMAMWRHYRINGDEKFLAESVIPVMRGAAEYYLDILKKGDDGFYHTEGTTAYEGTPPFTDAITDKVMIRSLFTTLRELVPESEKAVYSDVLDNLTDYITVPLDVDEISDGKLVYGFGKGRDVLADGKVFTVGIESEGKPRRKNYGIADERSFYGFPDTEMSPLYPGGIMSLADKGTELFDIMTNQINLHCHPIDCMQWCLMPIYLARMGMADDLIPYIREDISAWIPYFNGFSTDCQHGLTESHDKLKFYDTRVVGPDNIKLTDETHPVEAYRFRHFDMETLPIIAHAVCESLLQSYDGIIRVFPAVKSDDASAFTLYAEGGFKVSGDHNTEGTVITVESLRGEICKLALPEFFRKDKLSASKKKADGGLVKLNLAFSKLGNENILSLDGILAAGETVMIADCETDFVPCEKAKPNRGMKLCGQARLGTPAVHPQAKNI